MGEPVRSYPFTNIPQYLLFAQFNAQSLTNDKAARASASL
ncbi:hypothetical protein L580_0888 [Serratia fonticola AU-P3(3)]|nr:hypothetical protein L580_0888 [Serratia fonticola AU-P3(3)]